MCRDRPAYKTTIDAQLAGCAGTCRAAQTSALPCLQLLRRLGKLHFLLVIPALGTSTALCEAGEQNYCTFESHGRLFPPPPKRNCYNLTASRAARGAGKEDFCATLCCRCDLIPNLPVLDLAPNSSTAAVWLPGRVLQLAKFPGVWLRSASKM